MKEQEKNAEQKDENRLVQERLRKLEDIRKLGIAPYPHSYEKKNCASELRSKYASLKPHEVTSDSVSVAGRIMAVRGMGRLTFAQLQDSSGKIQLSFKEDAIGKECYEFLKKLDIGDFIGVQGIIFCTKTGELTVDVGKYLLLSKSLKPLPEKFHGLKDKEMRYRQRYLDLVVNPEVKQVFEKRAVIIDEIRGFLKENGFFEVETPLLQSVYGGAMTRPFTTHMNALNINLFLSISPELYLKRLVVGGFEKVFTICKNFRNEGIDAFHNPEFTMLEFYYAYADYNELMKMTEQLLERLMKKLNIPQSIEYGGKKISLKMPFKRIKFRDIVLEKTGIDINKANDYEKLKNEIVLKKLKALDIKGKTHYAALLDELYKRIVRPDIIQPTFLTHYPVQMIPLAKRNEEDKSKINTFQLLIDGSELVKAYDELNDPVEQEERLKEQAVFLGKGTDSEAMPMDEDFVNALKIGMPPTAGYGLGVDRLVMILTQQDSIRDVIFFPFMKPE
ncbi:MAG: lysine--tRNA ligase [Candidatus Woesearchaeota archaeon]